MTGIKKSVKVTILDFEGKFMLFSKLGKRLNFCNWASTVTSHLHFVSLVESSAEWLVEYLGLQFGNPFFEFIAGLKTILKQVFSIDLKIVFK